MAKKTTKKAAKKTTTKKAAKKTTAKKAAAPKAAKKGAAKKTTAKAGAKKSSRARYPEQLKKKVVSAIKKGMTHLEASKSFAVGVHSIPNWIKKHV